MTGPKWLKKTSPDDWLIDGHSIRGKYYLRMWKLLDWSKAWVDMGPSPAGNPGPYWHVPVEIDGDLMVKRLYPSIKILPNKGLLIARQAVKEIVAKSGGGPGR